ncbi:MAG: DUF4349 domain-containing protein [Candidatus Ventricola sp.]
MGARQNEMNCEALEAIVFSGREPDGQERAAMQAHAAHCEACRALLAQREVLCGARTMDEGVQAPESFARGWRRAVRQTPRAASPLRRAADWLRGTKQGRMTARAAAYACCAVALLGVGAQLGRTPAASQPQSLARSATPRYNVMMSEESAAYDEAYDDGAALGASLAGGSTAQAERKVVRTASLGLETAAFDAVVEAIREQTAQAGGLVTQCDIGGTEGSRYARLQLSVPAEALDGFLSGAQALGTVTYQTTGAEDMTDQYQDNAARLESAMARKRRLDELFAKAEDMEDIVTLTNAIFDVQEEIDRLTGANRRIDDRAQNARISLSVSELTEEPAEGFGARLLRAGRDGLGGFLETAQGIALWAARALPWLAVAALAVAWIVRARRRRM